MFRVTLTVPTLPYISSKQHSSTILEWGSLQRTALTVRHRRSRGADRDLIAIWICQLDGWYMQGQPRRRWAASSARQNRSMLCTVFCLICQQPVAIWLSDRLADWEDHAGPPGRRSAVLRARRKPRMRGSRRWPAGSRPWRRNLRSATRRCCCASCAASGASCSAGAGRATSPATPEGTGLACRALQGSAHARTNALPAHAARGIAAAAAKHA